jgi:serine/threonine-protein kinase
MPLGGGALGPTAPPRRDLPPGTLLNGIYEVRRFIARGGMGEVYEGVNVATDEVVAIKVMLPALAADPRTQALFRREARVLTELAHPALVHYLVLAQEPTLGLLYIVTEFIPGRSLAQTLGAIHPGLAELKALTRRLAEGLGAAHALGAIHRDLTPDNVLLPEGRLDKAKIIDFGIARETDPNQSTVLGDTFAGKLGFVAPEQFGDYGRQIGPWTDIYSLGLTVLALAAGKPIDMGQTLVDAVDRRREPIDLSPLPAILRPVFDKMLAPDPKDRWRSMAEVVQALDALDASPAAFFEPPLPSAVSEAPLAEAPVRFPKLALFVGGVAALALAVGLGFVLGVEPSAPDARVGASAAAAAATAAEPTMEVFPARAAAPPPASAAVQTAAVQPTVAAAAAPPAPVQAARPQPRPQAPVEVAAAAPVRAPAKPASVPPPPAQEAPVPSNARAAAEPATAPIPTKDYEACWRATGAEWTYLGYAGRQACAAQAFDRACQVVHARWGKDRLRRYDGKIQVRGSGPLARWRTLGPSTCAEGVAAR